MNSTGRPRIDYTNRDYDSLLRAMLELARERLPEWTDHSPNDLGVMLVELFAYMGDLLFYHVDRATGESYLDTATERRSVLHLLRLIGYELRPPRPASVDLTLLFRADATGPAVIHPGDEFRTTKEATGTPVGFRYVGQALTVDRTALPTLFLGSDGTLSERSGTEAVPYKVYRTLPVVQVDAMIPREILGSSDGSAGQRFPLASKPLVEASLVVTVNEGAGPTEWTRRDSLLHSGKDDAHYVVRRDENDTAWIEFGDNTYGRIPRRGANNITASYRTGGGKKGNVPPRAISKPVAAIDNLQRVMNEKAASGGADAEPTAEAARQGPARFRSMGRAVTAADFEAHARSFGIQKVRARAGAWNRVVLHIAPAGGGLPSDTLKNDLIAYFDSKRLLTSIVEVADPKYVPVTIAGRLTVEPGHFQSQIQQRARDVIRALWAFDEVDFGDTLYISKIYEAIEAIEGVAAVVVTVFSRPGPGGLPPPAPLPQDGTLRFAADEIPLVPGITFEAVEGGSPDV